MKLRRTHTTTSHTTMKNLRSFLFVFRNTTFNLRGRRWQLVRKRRQQRQRRRQWQQWTSFWFICCCKERWRRWLWDTLSFLSPKSSRFTMPTSGNALMVTSVFSTQYPPTEEQLMSTSLWDNLGFDLGKIRHYKNLHRNLRMNRMIRFGVGKTHSTVKRCLLGTVS